jgi:hypothetical protein
MGQYYSQVELYFKQLNVILLQSELMREKDSLIKNMLVQYKVQLGKKKSYEDLKKRLADCLSAMHNVKIEDSQVRLWKYSDKPDKLLESCDKISKASGQTVEVSESDSSNPDMEINSGVEFPGESIEPLLKANTSIEDETLDECVLVVEFKLNPESSFAFKFLKNQRITVGKCEFCT